MKKITTLAEHFEKTAGFLDVVRAHPVKSLLSAGALGTGLGVGGSALFGGSTPPRAPTRHVTEAIRNALENELGFFPELATGFATGFGSGVARELIDLTRRGGHKALVAVKANDQDAAFTRAVKEDTEVLQNADKETLTKAFDTMRRFAPTLATDPNAVKAYLRAAATSGSGVDYNTIKLLAEAESAVNKSMSGGGDHR